MQANTVNPQEPSSWLLQLTEAALALILQQLDQCSRACMAVSCSKLERAVLATTSKVAVHCSTRETFDGFKQWVGQHSSSLTSLTDCRIASYAGSLLTLPCRQLRQLYIKSCGVLLGPSSESTHPCWGPVAAAPGVLADCTVLTALDLQYNSPSFTIGSQQFVERPSAAAAAIAALSKLRSLRLAMSDSRGGPGATCGSYGLFAHLQLPLQLTHLNLETFHAVDYLWGQETSMRSQLSKLVNLAYLRLTPFPGDQLLGDLISNLVKLTCLDVSFTMWDMDPSIASRQLQHLSSLTVLQQLIVAGRRGPWHRGYEAIVPRFPQLTRLDLKAFPVDFSSSVPTWTCLTALQSLTLTDCKVQPASIAAFTQLRSLSLQWTDSFQSLYDPHSLKGILSAVSSLSLLTELFVKTPWFDGRDPDWQDRLNGMQRSLPFPEAFTALMASTNLCSLQLGFWRPTDAPQGWALFEPGTVPHPRYPHLTLISLAYSQNPAALVNSQAGRIMQLSTQQLQQLCSCCPAVQSLHFAHREDDPYFQDLYRTPSTTAAWSSLLQLSALTELTVQNVDAAAVPAVVSIAVQMTGLKTLGLWCVTHNLRTHEKMSRALLPLAALDGLEELSWCNTRYVITPSLVYLHNKARSGKCLTCGFSCCAKPCRI